MARRVGGDVFRPIVHSVVNLFQGTAAHYALNYAVSIHLYALNKVLTTLLLD